MDPSFSICWIEDWAICSYQIYFFGLSLTASFFLFLWMLKKLSIRMGFEYHFVTHGILWYFLGVFFFSRLFYVISMWRDTQHITDPFAFFIMSDYNFSLFGALFGFLSILFLNTRIFAKNFHKYMDGVVLSFLFVAIIGFIGAFLGAQVYGNITSYGIEIPYTNASSFVPLTGNLFPLPLVYSFICFLLFSGLYIASLYVKVRGLLGYVGLGIFSAVVVGLDFLSGKTDMFKSLYNVNLSQISAMVLIVFCFYGIFRVMYLSTGKTQKTILHTSDE